MIQLTNICLARARSDGPPIIHDITLSISAGERVAIVGGNGAGKSTLLNIMGGMIRPSSGSIMLDGYDMTRYTLLERAQAISTVLQDPKAGTLCAMTIAENMAFACKRGQRRGLHLFQNKAREKTFIQALHMMHMGLEDRLNEKAGNFSGGQRQALSVVMACAQPCKVLLLDEITAALDPHASAHIMAMTDQMIRHKNLTAVMVTHNLHDALRYSDRIVVMQGGRCQFIFTASDKETLTPSALMQAMVPNLHSQ